MVTVRSKQFWIASTQVRCFSCIGLTTALGLVFPSDSTIDRPEQGVPAADEVKYFQLIYVRQVSARTLEDIVQLHPDHDLRLGFRYVVNHCDRCRTTFSDSKLFASPEGLLCRQNPDRVPKIAFRRRVVPIVATGCMVPVANHFAKAISTAPHERIALPA